MYNGSQSYMYIAPTCASFYTLPSFNAYLDQDGSWLQIPEQQLWVGRRHDSFSLQWIGLWSWIVQASSPEWSNPWPWTWSRNRLAWSVQIEMSCRCELFLRYLWKKKIILYNSLFDTERGCLKRRHVYEASRPRGLEATWPKLILASCLWSSTSKAAWLKFIFLNIGVKTLKNRSPLPPPHGP